MLAKNIENFFLQRAHWGMQKNEHARGARKYFDWLIERVERESIDQGYFRFPILCFQIRDYIGIGSPQIVTHSA